jgi:hypothetical protein
MVTAIACRKYSRVTRPAIFIDDDPILALKSGRLGDFRVRHSANPHDEKIRLNNATIATDHTLHTTITLESLDAGVTSKGDAVSAMFHLEIFRHTGRHHAIHYPVGQFKNGDRTPAVARRRRNLEADITTTNDHDSNAGGQLGVKGMDVIDIP